MRGVHSGMQIIGLPYPLFSSPPNLIRTYEKFRKCRVAVDFWLGQGASQKGRGSAGWLAFLPAVHFCGRGGGLQRCERFQDFVGVARTFRHDPRVARFQVHDLAFDM
jgi:hypothetical protein